MCKGRKAEGGLTCAPVGLRRSWLHGEGGGGGRSREARGEEATEGALVRGVDGGERGFEEMWTLC